MPVSLTSEGFSNMLADIKTSERVIGGFVKPDRELVEYSGDVKILKRKAGFSDFPVYHYVIFDSDGTQFENITSESFEI